MAGNGAINLSTIPTTYTAIPTNIANDTIVALLALGYITTETVGGILYWRSTGKTVNNSSSGSGSTISGGSSSSSTNATPGYRIFTGVNPLNILYSDNFGIISIRQTTPTPLTVNFFNNLPTNFTVTIVDAMGQAAANNITVNPPSGILICNATSRVIITNYTAITFYFDGVGINII